MWSVFPFLFGFLEQQIRNRLILKVTSKEKHNGLLIIVPVIGSTNFLKLLELRHVRAQYAGEVTLVDKWFGIFMEKVSDLGLSENTKLIFLSVDGEPWGERAMIRKAFDAQWPYEELSHVPLITRFPDSMGIKLKRIQSSVGMPDIMPTTLDFLNIKGADTMHGKSLLPLVQEGEEDERCFGIRGFFEMS